MQQARLQTLKSNFEMLHMKEDETIDTFTTKLTTLVNKAASLGHTMEDGKLVQKLLNVVPDRYLQIVASIEQYSDLSEMTLEEAIGRLKTYEERIKYKKDKQVDNQEKLMFTRYENKGKYFRGHGRYKETNKDSLWYLDNGASNHMTGVREHFKELDEKVSGKVRFGDGSYIEIKGKGLILIECDDEKQRIISHVYYISDLKSNLLSLRQFTEICCKVVMEDDELRLYDMDKKIFMKVTRQRNRLYKANLRIGAPVCLLANLKDDTWLWHARLEHLNFESLKSMAQRDFVYRIPTIKLTTQVCDVCLIGKHSRAPFPKKAKARSTLPLNLVNGDLCGPITPPTPSGKKYIFLLVDDYSRYMWVYFLNAKDQAFDTFKEYKKSIENELRTTLKMLRMDRGGEFTSNEFMQYYKENGIARQLTAPYSPQQNGVVKRRNGTIIDVKFKENETWDWKDYMSEHINDEREWTNIKIGNLEITNEHHDQGFQPIRGYNEFPNNDDDDYASPTRDTPTHSQTPHTPSIRSSEVNSQVTPNISIQSNYRSDNVSIQTINLPSHFDHTPLRVFRTLNDLYENNEELLLAKDEPKNYKEASRDQKWIEAMKAELDSINRNNT
nr:zinc finger, CCHC-type [Tanacetum cinerariifolium]